MKSIQVHGELFGLVNAYRERGREYNDPVLRRLIFRSFFDVLNFEFGFREVNLSN